MNTQQLAKLRSIVPEMRRVRHIHFVGIGGAGMGDIAEVLANEGYHISGSDLDPNPVTQNLIALGATIYFNHRPENVTDASVWWFPAPFRRITQNWWRHVNSVSR